MANRTFGRNRHGSLGRSWAGVALAAVLWGCASEQLVPLGPTENGLAKQSKEGLQVSARVERGADYVPTSLTPVKIAVHNGSSSGVYVELEDIALVASGHAMAAIPPNTIEPRPPVQSLGVDPASPFAPQAPIYAPGGAGGGQRSIGQGPIYESSIAGLGEPGGGQRMFQERARAELAREAFPGGYIGSGETREGLVYFATPPRGAERVDLQVKVRSGEGSGPAVVLEIPYSVEG